ncbi:unnamed protein product [Cladocopium goreaui]|uniref:Derlin n=1 Tax=Cladocopium goreaui TaxID=2562237 RepID=A0A9P1CG42_9DINO|nr:unnamed protein product [Cladocopium goreaui]
MGSSQNQAGDLLLLPGHLQLALLLEPGPWYTIAPGWKMWPFKENRPSTCGCWSVSQGVIVVLAYLFGSQYFVSGALIDLMTYLWGRRNPTARMQVLFFTIRTPYLPWVLSIPSDGRLPGRSSQPCDVEGRTPKPDGFFVQNKSSWFHDPLISLIFLFLATATLPSVP